MARGAGQSPHCLPHLDPPLFLNTVRVTTIILLLSQTSMPGRANDQRVICHSVKKKQYL